MASQVNAYSSAHVPASESRPRISACRVALVVLLAAVLSPALTTPARAQEGGAPAAGSESPSASSGAGTAAAAAEKPPLIPENISTYGGDVDWLFNLILVITLIAMVVVEVLIVWFVVRYRYRPNRRAEFSHGSKKLEVLWTAGTALILLYIAVVQWNTWTKIKTWLPDEGSDTYLVRVFGERFGWWFVYPGTDGTFLPDKLEARFTGFNDVGLEGYDTNNPQDLVMQELVVPVNTPVILQLNSLGKYDPNTQKAELPVLHSFFIPNLRLKQDLVPFHPDKVWFEATKTGTYEIACAELCGEGHYKMFAKFTVMEEEELKAKLGYDWTQHPATLAGVDERAAEPSKPGD